MSRRSFRYRICSVCLVNWVLLTQNNNSTELLAVCEKCKGTNSLTQTVENITTGSNSKLRNSRNERRDNERTINRTRPTTSNECYVNNNSNSNNLQQPDKCRSYARLSNDSVVAPLRPQYHTNSMYDDYTVNWYPKVVLDYSAISRYLHTNQPKISTSSQHTISHADDFKVIKRATGNVVVCLNCDDDNDNVFVKVKEEKLSLYTTSNYNELNYEEPFDSDTLAPRDIDIDHSQCLDNLDTRDNDSKVNHVSGNYDHFPNSFQPDRVDCSLLYSTPDLILRRVDNSYNINKSCVHQCHSCPKIFKRTSALAGHECTHMNTLPYAPRIRDRKRDVFNKSWLDGKHMNSCNSDIEANVEPPVKPETENTFQSVYYQFCNKRQRLSAEQPADNSPQTVAPPIVIVPETVSQPNVIAPETVKRQLVSVIHKNGKPNLSVSHSTSVRPTKQIIIQAAPHTETQKMMNCVPRTTTPFVLLKHKAEALSALSSPKQFASQTVCVPVPPAVSNHIEGVPSDVAYHAICASQSAACVTSCSIVSVPQTMTQQAVGASEPDANTLVLVPQGITQYIGSSTRSVPHHAASTTKSTAHHAVHKGQVGLEPTVSKLVAPDVAISPEAVTQLTYVASKPIVHCTTSVHSTVSQPNVSRIRDPIQETSDAFESVSQRIFPSQHRTIAPHIFPPSSPIAQSTIGGSQAVDQRSKISVRDPLPHACSICFQQFPGINAMLKFQQFQLPQPSEKCSICREACNTGSLLKEHYRLKHRSEFIQLLTCKFCRYESESVMKFVSGVPFYTGNNPSTQRRKRCRTERTLAVERISAAHECSIRYKCLLCNDSFEEFGAFQLHRKMHSAELLPYLCMMCYERCSSENLLFSHIERVHNIHDTLCVYTHVSLHIASAASAVSQQAASSYQAVSQQAASSYQAISQQAASSYQVVSQQAASSYQAVSQQATSSYQAISQQAASSYQAVSQQAASSYQAVSQQAASASRAISQQAAASVSQAVTKQDISLNVNSAIASWSYPRYSVSVYQNFEPKTFAPPQIAPSLLSTARHKVVVIPAVTNQTYHGRPRARAPQDRALRTPAQHQVRLGQTVTRQTFNSVPRAITSQTVSILLTPAQHMVGMRQPVTLQPFNSRPRVIALPIIPTLPTPGQHTVGARQAVTLNTFVSEPRATAPQTIPTICTTVQHTVGVHQARKLQPFASRPRVMEPQIIPTLGSPPQHQIGVRQAVTRKTFNHALQVIAPQIIPTLHTPPQYQVGVRQAVIHETFNSEPRATAPQTIPTHFTSAQHTVCASQDVPQKMFMSIPRISAPRAARAFQQAGSARQNVEQYSEMPVNEALINFSDNDTDLTSIR